MKQKMCIKLSVNSEKYTKKAMKVAAGSDGVTSVAVEGESKDKLMVIGDGVDAVRLVNVLRKKTCYATLETVEEVKPQKKPQTEEKKPQTEDKSVASRYCVAQCPMVSYELPPPHTWYRVVSDPYGPNPGCSIM